METSVETHSFFTDSERSVWSTVACSPKSAIFASYAEQSPAHAMKDSHSPLPGK